MVPQLRGSGNSAGVRRNRIGEQRERGRLTIARAMRRHADRASVVERFGALAGNSAVERRIAAAELFGWIPGSAADAALETLAASTVPEIADAVLKAQNRREAHDHAGTLLAEMPNVDHLGRWSRLQAVVDLADPYLNESDPDGLALGPTADAFGEAFAIGAECVIKKRKDALEKDADRSACERDRKLDIRQRSTRSYPGHDFLGLEASNPWTECGQLASRSRKLIFLEVCQLFCEPSARGT